MKSTLNELSKLVSSWEALRKSQPNVNIPGIKIEDINNIFNSWQEGLEVAVTRTRAAQPLEEQLIDAALAKLMRDTCSDVHLAEQQGLGWMIRNRPFMENLSSIALHLSMVLTKRIDIRKGLLKIAASNLNDKILSVEKVAPLATQLIQYHKKIVEQSESVEAAVNESQEISDELAAVKEKVLADQSTIAELLASANKNQEDLKQHTETLESIIEASQSTLDRITKQKSDADTQIATGAELLANANAQLTKALEDINRQGLAGAFSKRAIVVFRERVGWLMAFCVSIGWLIYVAYTSGSKVFPFDLMNFLRGIPLAAPGIWLGWLSARQISILARIQQDYAYKASTAVAFEGYKKEVANANDQALSKQLLETAITNFGENPVRLYDKKGDDHGHPVEALVEKIKDTETRNFVVEIFKALKPDMKK